MGCFSTGGTEVEQSSTLTKGQRDLLDALTSQLVPQVGQGVTPYSGKTIAPVSGLQRSAFQNAGGLGGLGSLGIGAGVAGMQGYNPQQGYDILNTAQNNLSGATQAFDPKTIMDALKPGQELAMNTFNRDVIPQLLERFGATSGGSGAMNQAFGDAARDLSLGLSAQAAPYLIQGQQNQLDRQLQGATIGSDMSQLPASIATQSLSLGAGGTDLLSALANMGSLQRGISQEELTGLVNKYYESQPYNNPWLKNFGPLALGTTAFENVATQQPMGLGTLTMLGAMNAAGSYYGAKA